MEKSFSERVFDDDYISKLPYAARKVAPDVWQQYHDDQRRLHETFIEDAQNYAIGHGVPTHYTAKVVRRAWEDGHAAGYHEVYNCLQSLIEIFEEN